MSKNVKIVTKVVSILLVLIMVFEVAPTNALAAFVTEVQGGYDENQITQYDEAINFFYDSHGIDVGRAGTLSINDYTLIPSLSFNALGIDGNLFPVNISMQYNSVEYRFLKDVTGYAFSAYGNGWMTNYNNMLCEIQFEDKTQLVYLSGNGSVTTFEQIELTENDTELPDGSTRWENPEIEGVYIIKISDESVSVAEDFSQYTMHADDTTWVFDKFGRLTSIKNSSNFVKNTISYTYNDGTNLEYIEKITDGVGNEYRFEYADGMLIKIKCYDPEGNAIVAGDGENAASLEMNFAYTNDNLTTVTFPDGKMVHYAYNESGEMFRATNIDGYKAEITYVDGRVSRFAEYSTKGTLGTYVDITCNENTRTFTDDKGEVQVKTFDKNGVIITIVDGDGNYLYGAPVEDEIIPEENETEEAPDEETSDVYEIVCPCDDCPEWECTCECVSEDVCNCVQCKRYLDTTEDEFGNILLEESFDGTKTMLSQNTYTENGNYRSSSVDTSGNTVYYVYDAAGFMQTMTSGDMEVMFDYDSMGNLTRLYQQVSGLSNGTTMSNQYTYTDDKVTSISHNGFSYDFTYDEWGNQTSVKIADTTLIEYEYADREGSQISEITYATGKSVSYTYNDDGNITGVSYNGGETKVYEYTYDENGTLSTVTDNVSRLVTTYSDTEIAIKFVDNNYCIYSIVSNEDGTETENLLGYSVVYTYNSEYNAVTGKTVSTKSFTNTIEVSEESAYSGIQNIDMSVTTDWFGRTETKDIVVDNGEINSDVTAEYSYTYADTDTTASTKVTSHSSTFVSENYTNSRTDHYEYDATGNITGIYRYVDGVKTYFYNYKYDEAGQLVREDSYEDNKTILYVYDVGGNIVSKTEYEYTLDDITAEMSPENVSTYSYNNSYMKDMLTGYTSTADDINTTLTYDEVGNITYFNGQTYTWNANRQLETVTTEDGQLYKYYYNENGFLIKVDTYDNNSNECSSNLSYIWNGDVLVARVLFDYESGDITVSKVIYDSEGEAVGTAIKQKTTEGISATQVLLYRKNLQGDITGLIDSVSGQLVAAYTYDAYGMLVTHPTNDNQFSVISSVLMLLALPQAYRGYTFSFVGDELCYYLGSRFYSPRLGRFINADDIDYVCGGTTPISSNLYAYCFNDPVNNLDPDGHLTFKEACKWLLKVINKVLDYSQNVVEFLLSKYTVSSKKYIKMTSYGKNPQAIYTFIYNNKSSIKNLKNNLSSIAWFLGILIEIIDLSSVLTKQASYVKAVAEIMFDGLVKLFTYCGAAFGTWLITSICKPLKIAKNLINTIINTLIDGFFNNSNRIKNIKQKYLNNINVKSISFKNYIYALFVGVKQCI
ncbi:RHS repeat-associated core domain-containing protein [bacterium]|nr:RHS repeat-associated core domain-containing protein [bacterium]